VTKYCKFILILVLIISIPNITKSYANYEEPQCNDEDYTQICINVRAYDSYKNTDKYLNETYQKKMGSLNKDAQHKLRLQERRWIKKINTACKAKADNEVGDGSMWSMVFNYCLEEHTKKRIDELNKIN
jgi:uncharacterized protein YecT (DUF1311 family)